MKARKRCRPCRNGKHQHYFASSCHTPLGKDPVDTATRSGWCECQYPVKKSRRIEAAYSSKIQGWLNRRMAQ